MSEGACCVQGRGAARVRLLRVCCPSSLDLPWHVFGIDRRFASTAPFLHLLSVERTIILQLLIQRRDFLVIGGLELLQGFDLLRSATTLHVLPLARLRMLI